MVLLGIVIHASLLYESNVFHEKVFFNDPKNHSVFFNVLADLIHTFRMPIFYVISGFFTALLYLDRGARKMLHNRLNRLAYPFVLGLLLLYPFHIFSLNFFAVGLNGTPDLFGAAFSATRHTITFRDLYTIHLWFIYYLIWYCAAVVILAYTINRWLPAIRQPFVHYFRILFQSKMAPAVFAIPTAIGLYALQSFDLKAADSFCINWLFFATFGLYFLFGWLCYCIKDELSRFEKGTWTYLIVATLLFVLRWKLLQDYHAPNVAVDMKATIGTELMVLHAFCIWFFVYGLIGFFVQYSNKASKMSRYISDGSYWIYLIHMPIVIMLQTLLLRYNVPSGIKFVFVNLLTFLVTVLSYNYLVRNTFIGQFLNGRKHPRSF